MTIIERLAKHSAQDKPLLCFEVNPPRGVDLAPTYARLDGNVTGIDFFNVTDSALAKMRLGGLPFASLLKERYKVEPLVNLACRDRNVIALQGDLLAGWVSGLRSVVALTGDAVSIGDLPECKGVFEINSIGLLNIISTLNSGRDVAGNQLNGAPNFIPGVVVNPNAKNVNAELRRLNKKKEAGAVYALSQPVFDIESSQAFFKGAQEIGISILVGLLPYKSGASLTAISKIPGIRIPERLSKIAEEDPNGDMSELSIENALEIARANSRYVAGFHVISGATPKLGLRLVRCLAEMINKG